MARKNGSDRGPTVLGNYRFLEKIWPTERSPLQPVRHMVLDRNPTNYFAEVEQVALAVRTQS